MGTVKRERQKANRQLRLEEIAKQARRDKTKRTGLRLGIVLAAVVALVGVVWLVSDPGSSSTASTTSTIPGTVAPGSTIPSTTTPPRPAIKVPASIPTKLVVTELRAGKGPKAANGDTVDVHYMGVLTKNGQEFDNSYDRKQSYAVVLGTGAVIKGWDQGLVGVQAGGQYQLDIPADLAYGASGNGTIGPNEALTFVIDVMAVTPAAPTATSVPTATT